MVDMARTDDEMEEMMGGDVYTPPNYPGGLCISLTHNELSKLGLDADCEVGDLLHAVCMAKVTSVSKTEDSCRIEMQIIDIEVLEDETTEYQDRPKIRPEKFYKG